MGSRYRFGVVALACASAAGCSLLVSTTGLSGSAASTTEAGPDGPNEGGNPSGDAASDGGAVDGAEAGLCDDAVLCDDFEDASDALWTTVDEAVDSGGTVARDGVRPRSGARSLHCTRTRPMNGRGFVRAKVSPAALTCELDVYVDGVPDGQNVEVLTLKRSVDGFSAYEPAYVFVRPAGVMLGEYKQFPDGGEENRRVDLALAGGGVGRWVHLTVTLSATTSSLEARVDGAPAVSGSLMLTQSASPPTVILSFTRTRCGEV